MKSSPVLAVVDGAPITEDLFRLGWERRPGASDTPAARQALLEQMIQRSALAQAARHAGLDQDPLVIEQFESLLISRLKTVQLQPRLEAVRVSDAEIQSFYQTNRDAKFTEPEGVRVAVRDPEAALFLKPMGAVGQVVPLFASVMNEATVQRAVAGAEVVVNLVGVLTESSAASFQAIHTDGSERIARIAAANGVSRLIQISAIGADPNSPSRYAATKGKAEQAVLAAFPEATILRPSLVFGLEDKFFNRFAEIARIAPFMPVICGGTLMR